jgi:hypothetical protein
MRPPELFHKEAIAEYPQLVQDTGEIPAVCKNRDSVLMNGIKFFNTSDIRTVLNIWLSTNGAFNSEELRFLYNSFALRPLCARPDRVCSK